VRYLCKYYPEINSKAPQPSNVCNTSLGVEDIREILGKNDKFI